VIAVARAGLPAPPVIRQIDRLECPRAVDLVFRYRDDILVLLLAHGVRPTGHTPPQLVRDYVRDLYKYEIRRLRERYMRRDFPKVEYAGRVDDLRRRYPVLALLPNEFIEP
jgi:hypothetical protein